ncbi:hypothetical protein N9481_02385 [Pelagibacteraceae bacterium]|nr:hypothetical protein [Pelagibacteraceae bacterium]
MTNLDISNTDYAKQLIQSLEQDRTFNIELKEASNVFLEKSVETYYDFYEKGKRGSFFNCVIFYFPEPRQSDVGLFIEDTRGLYIKADHKVIATEDSKSCTMMRSFISHNSKSFSTKEIQNIKDIYLKAIYKTAEQVFHLENKKN